MKPIIKAYLCESVLVQNSLLELHDFSEGKTARIRPPGGPEEGRITKGPGREIPGGGTFGRNVRQTPPLVEALGIPESSDRRAYGHRGSTMWVLRAVAWKSTVRDHDR